ncbi:hypothetical protein [Actinoallomurus sp. CA-142502]|uniref:hypothetical protein n=1 Tax=Actinoallomurus sp. CA-142502 TaxID=3239885 RepID=UPI003D8FDA69
MARDFAHLKNRLMPYLYGAAVEATRTGVPVMRPRVLEFPDDPPCAMLDRAVHARRRPAGGPGLPGVRPEGGETGACVSDQNGRTAAEFTVRHEGDRVRITAPGSGGSAPISVTSGR